MSIRTTILASGAIIALIGAPLATSESATAASIKNESAQTRDLNLQQLKTPGTADVTANTASNTTGSTNAKAAPKSANASTANKTDTTAADKDQITADEMKKAVSLTKVEMPK